MAVVVQRDFSRAPSICHEKINGYRQIAEGDIPICFLWARALSHIDANAPEPSPMTMIVLSLLVIVGVTIALAARA